jgi:hypothetical protein
MPVRGANNRYRVVKNGQTENEKNDERKRL